jgi:oligopeptide/dipeptide ABC transporter ATP-binding protein
VAVMYAGRLLEIATSEQILHAAAHPYTQGLLGSFPSLKGPRRVLSGIPGSPPDLRSLPAGCPFLPRCAYRKNQCSTVDMALVPVGSEGADEHRTACPFVSAGTSTVGLSGTADRGTDAHSPAALAPGGFAVSNLAGDVVAPDQHLQAEEER